MYSVLQTRPQHWAPSALTLKTHKTRYVLQNTWAKLLHLPRVMVPTGHWNWTGVRGRSMRKPPERRAASSIKHRYNNHLLKGCAFKEISFIQNAQRKGSLLVCLVKEPESSCGVISHCYRAGLIQLSHIQVLFAGWCVIIANLLKRQLWWFQRCHQDLELSSVNHLYTSALSSLLGEI